jgi:hypothetical protein
MEEPTHNPPATRPPQSRRRRPAGRWTNPASPLQAARLARRESGKEVVAGIRKVCPGHGTEKCRIDQSKLSDYENNRRRPSTVHIEAFCRYYQMSAEDLGLITWRDQPVLQPNMATPTTPDPAYDHDDRDPTLEQLVVGWLRDSVVDIATAVFRALVRCPINLTEEELRRIIGAPWPGGRETSEDDASPNAPGGETARPTRSGPRSNGVTEQTDGIDLSATYLEK